MASCWSTAKAAECQPGRLRTHRLEHGLLAHHSMVRGRLRGRDRAEGARLRVRSRRARLAPTWPRRTWCLTTFSTRRAPRTADYWTFTRSADAPACGPAIRLGALLQLPAWAQRQMERHGSDRPQVRPPDRCLSRHRQEFMGVAATAAATRPHWPATCAAAGTQSCGCLWREAATRHGASGTPTYSSWRSMVAAAPIPADPSFDRYGGARGHGLECLV